MKAPDVVKSGGCGKWAYYVRGNKQCRRLYVVPNDPGTAKQLRARAAFSAASKAWSQSREMTEEQRVGWIAAGRRCGATRG